MTSRSTALSKQRSRPSSGCSTSDSCAQTGSIQAGCRMGTNLSYCSQKAMFADSR
jgi:hypothetical protein